MSLFVFPLHSNAGTSASCCLPSTWKLNPSRALDTTPPSLTAPRNEPRHPHYLLDARPRLNRTHTKIRLTGSHGGEKRTRVSRHLILQLYCSSSASARDEEDLFNAKDDGGRRQQRRQDPHPPRCHPALLSNFFPFFRHGAPCLANQSERNNQQQTLLAMCF